MCGRRRLTLREEGCLSVSQSVGYRGLELQLEGRRDFWRL